MSLPYFNLYPTDFEADTSHLTLEEDGAYNRLLRLMWITPGCSLPDDDAWIMRRIRCDAETFARVVLPVIAEFMKRHGGRVFSPRLMREWKKVDVTSRKRSEAGKKGGRPQHAEKKEKDEKPGYAFAKAGLFDTRALPEPEPEPDKREAKASRASPQKDQIAPVLEAWASPAAAASFIAYRRKAKSGFTLTAAKRLAENLKAIFNAGGDPDDALGMAEERGWQTVKPDWYFREKGQGNGNGNRIGQAEGSGDRQLRIILAAAQSR